MNGIEKEKLEVLNGDRGDKSRSAVRTAAALALVNNLGTEPSGDNSKDIAALFAAINALRIALR
jgi:hypothetical protein